MRCNGNLILVLLIFFGVDANASSLFDDNTVLDISLVGPLSSLFEDKNDSSELPFILRTTAVEHSIDVRVRGNSRRRVCDFPPLRLNFPAGETRQTVFDDQDKLKLVTHCRNRESDQIKTLQEYAAYRIFNRVSDISYRVRLLRVTYTDTDAATNEDTLVRYAFLIEPSSDLAKRVAGQAAKVSGVSLKSLDLTQAATVFVFQYLIGNTDWSLVTADTDDTCCHNGDLFDIGSARYYVPYDFDLSGLVNARYAKPDPSLRISKVTERLYRGYCIDSDAVESALGSIKARRADILNEIRELPGVSQKNIEATIKYLETFFVRAENEARILRHFERNCL